MFSTLLGALLGGGVFVLKVLGSNPSGDEVRNGAAKGDGEGAGESEFASSCVETGPGVECGDTV